jgi:hypothetical protein
MVMIRLVNNHREFSLEQSAWAFLVARAEENEWQKAGTSPANGVRSSGWVPDYLTADGRLVSMEDASNMAAAVSREPLPTLESAALMIGLFVRFAREGEFSIQS